MVTRTSVILFLLFLGAICFAQTRITQESHLTNDISPYVEQEQEETLDNLTKWINELELYECRDCPIGYKRIDTNGYYSYGCLQFQMATFKEYANKFYSLENLEETDWQNIISNCDFQKELAYKMIEENSHAVWRWKTSIERGLGLPILDK